MNLPFNGMVLLSAFSFIANVASKYSKSSAVDLLYYVQTVDMCSECPKSLIFIAHALVHST